MGCRGFERETAHGAIADAAEDANGVTCLVATSAMRFGVRRPGAALSLIACECKSGGRPPHSKSRHARGHDCRNPPRLPRPPRLTQIEIRSPISFADSRRSAWIRLTMSKACLILSALAA